jgi:hypothetical protein
MSFSLDDVFDHFQFDELLLFSLVFYSFWVNEKQVGMWKYQLNNSFLSLFFRQTIVNNFVPNNIIG